MKNEFEKLADDLILSGNEEAALKGRFIKRVIIPFGEFVDEPGPDRKDRIRVALEGLEQLSAMALNMVG